MLLLAKLKELNFGIFDGKSRSYVKKHHEKVFKARELNKFHYRIPDGESYKMVYNRVYSFLKSIYEKNSQRNVIIVTHATTLKMFLYILTNRKLEDIENIYYKNNSLFKFEISRSKDAFISRCLIFNSTIDEG